MRETDVKIVYLPDHAAYERLRQRNELEADTVYMVGGGIGYDDLDEHMQDILRAKADKNSVNNALGVLELDLTNAKHDILVAQNAAELANNKAQENAATKYAKPPDGIPEDDLTAAVKAKLNSGGGSVTPEQIAAAVEAYMAAHPITETDPTVPDWAKAAAKPSYTASEIKGAVQRRIWMPGALVQFDDNGYINAAPVKADEIATVEKVLAALPTWDGGDF